MQCHTTARMSKYDITKVTCRRLSLSFCKTVLGHVYVIQKQTLTLREFSIHFWRIKPPNPNRWHCKRDTQEGIYIVAQSSCLDLPLNFSMLCLNLNFVILLRGPKRITLLIQNKWTLDGISANFTCFIF